MNPTVIAFLAPILASKWFKIALGIISTIAGLGWLVPFLQRSSTWEARDSIIVILGAGNLLGFLTSSGLAHVNALAYARRAQASNDNNTPPTPKEAA